MLGASFLLGGLKYHLQEYNRVNARFQAGLLFLATVALLIPSAVGEADSAAGAAFTERLSVALAALLLATYGLGLWFSLKTHRELFAVPEHIQADEVPLPIGVALALWHSLLCLSRWLAKCLSSRYSRQHWHSV
jgi:Ca2+:H+ antiporter